MEENKKRIGVHEFLHKKGVTLSPKAYFVDATHCSVLSTDANHRILLAGVDGLSITHSKDVTLICPQKELASQQARARKYFNSHSVSIHNEVIP